VISFFQFFILIPWKECLEFPVGVFLVLSKEIKGGAPYIVRVLDIEIPSIAGQEMRFSRHKDVGLKERMKRSVKRFTNCKEYLWALPIHRRCEIFLIYELKIEK
jgi:hypothetical protein